MAGHCGILAATRQMRDLWRISLPDIVQNAGPVNIASDGGQQVNVQKSKQSEGRAKEVIGNTERCKPSGKGASKTKPKQLAAKSVEESIRMKSASDVVL